METVPSISDLFPSPSAAAAQKPRTVEEMGSEEFLTLMVAQLQNQDPTQPMDNMQFIAQLAQFGTVSGVQELNEGFAGLATALSGNQALQAASLVGRDVMVEGNVGQLQQVDAEAGDDGWSLSATVDIASGATNGTYYIQDAGGRLVYSGSIPPDAGRSAELVWNGRDAEGNLLPPGRYRISAEAIVGGQATNLPVHAHQRVESVAVEASSGEVTLNLANGGSVAIERVKQFF